MKIAVAGCGIVGGTLVEWLRHGTPHQVRIHDPGKGLIHDFRGDLAVFICVPAPTNKDGTQDLSVLKDVLSKIPDEVVVFVRTTVLPGTCDSLGQSHRGPVSAMPEFLTERRAQSDFLSQPVVVGLPADPIKADTVKMFAETTLRGKKLIFTPNRAAELAKYAHNTYAAVKVNYMNLISELSEYLGVNYKEDVLPAMGVTGFLGKEHVTVPGPDGKRGFGNKCLPKDLRAFIRFIADTPTPVDRFSSLTNVVSENKIRRPDAEQ